VRRVDEVVLRSGVTVPVPIRSLLVVRSPATPALGTQGQPAQQCCSRRPKNGLGRKRLITGAHIFGMRKEARHAEFLHGLDLRRQHLNPMHRASDVHAPSHWCATDRRHTAVRVSERTMFMLSMSKCARWSIAARSTPIIGATRKSGSLNAARPLCANNRQSREHKTHDALNATRNERREAALLRTSAAQHSTAQHTRCESAWPVQPRPKGRRRRSAACDLL
jgi:hypothetical protein